MMIKIINQKLKKMKIKKIINQPMNQNNYRYSFALPFILSNISLSENANSVTRISFAVFILSIIALLCFINIILYTTTYVIITKGDYENKYPKLKRLINYYKNTSLIFISIEVFFCFICLLLLVTFSFLIMIK